MRVSIRNQYRLKRLAQYEQDCAERGFDLLLGLAELAWTIGASKQYTSNLRARKRIPVADYELRMGPVWKTETIRQWLKTDP